MSAMVTLLDWIGRISTVIVLVSIVLGIYAWARGILPVLFRLGNGLARKKIAIFAQGSNADSLKNLLTDTKLFSERNIIIIASVGDFGRAEEAALFVVSWPDWENEMMKILEKKRDKTALVVYAKPGAIGSELMTTIDESRNSFVSNFRGRLLNDIVVSLITAG